MDGESKEIRIKNLQDSKGNFLCLDCREVVAEGLPFWSVYSEGFWVGATHSLDGNCQNGHNPIEGKKDD